MDSAKSHLEATGGKVYLFPQPGCGRSPCSGIPEEMPTDKEGIEARAKRMKCQVLSSELKPETKVYRSGKEAWELVVQNISWVRTAMKRHGMLVKNHPHEEYFFCLGIDAAYFAALTWDSETGFFTHLMAHMKRCWRPIFETMAIVPFSRERAKAAKAYRHWKKENPGGGPQEYAKDKGIPLKKAFKHKRDYNFRYGTTNPLDGHRAFNALSMEEAPEAYREKGNVSQQDAEAVLWWNNPLDLQRQLNRWDRSKALSRIWEIIGEVLNPQEQKLMYLRLKEGKTQEEIRAAPIWKRGSVSRARVQQVEAKAMLKLGSSKFRDELRECLSAFT
jgi:hypothetical protein